MDSARDETARRERAVDLPGSMLGHESADEAAHRGTEREDTLRLLTDGSCEGVDRLELVPGGALERPPRAVRVVGRARDRIAPVEQCVLDRRRQVLPVLAEPTDVAVRARARAYVAAFETLRKEFVGSVCRPSLDSASS